MTSASSVADSSEVLDCQEFYPHFLDPIPEDIRRDLISLFHELSKDGASSENASERCKGILIKVEKELGVDNFICETVAKEFAECLRKLGLVTDAIEFMENRLQRLETQDFGTLMILGSIYELSGKYSKALKKRNEALKLAELSGDPILISLSFVKLACDLYNFNKPDEARNKISSCLKKLEGTNVSLNVDHFPFTESVHRIIDLYKTLGYFHRFFPDPSKSSEYYYIKALDIVEQDENAHVHILKLETRIASAYSYNANFKTETYKYAMSAYKRIKDLRENESFKIYHTITILHAMSRVAHALQQAGNKHNALTIREEAYELAEKYLSQNHHDVARIAADTAYLCFLIKEPKKEPVYILKARNALENCDNDFEFLKLHVREISDAWKTLGLLYSERRNLDEAQKSFNEAVQINIRVYGKCHARLARLYKCLGHLYKRFNRFSEAIKYFTDCKGITSTCSGDFSLNNTKLQKQAKKEISICKSLQRKSLQNIQSITSVPP